MTSPTLQLETNQSPSSSLISALPAVAEPAEAVPGKKPDEFAESHATFGNAAVARAASRDGYSPNPGPISNVEANRTLQSIVDRPGSETATPARASTEGHFAAFARSSASNLTVP